MTLQIAGRNINNVLIVDDDARVRDVYTYPVEDLNLHPVLQEDRISDLNDFIERTVTNGVDAAICDYQLKATDYSRFNGAELVSAWYENRFPAILCTKWDGVKIDEIRRYRKNIPIMLNPEELDTETIFSGFNACIQEFMGEFEDHRKAYRTLVRVEDIDAEGAPHRRIYVVVPAWNHNEVISLFLNDIPSHLRERIKPETRLHARVNIGNENDRDLYFVDWDE